MAQRVGNLWMTGRTVYSNKDGSLFSMDQGVRVRLHFNQRWTTSTGIRMRGQTPLGSPLPYDEDDESDSAGEDGGTDDDERRQIELAIAASLEESSTGDGVYGGLAPAAAVGGSMSAADPSRPADASETTAANADAQHDGGGSSSDAGRRCAICLTEAPTYICRPCNHCCACESCQRRLGNGRPCPICRRPARTMERVFFA